MTAEPKKILRLEMPQWQGGDVPGYIVGGRVLSAIAPAGHGPVETIAVPEAGSEARPDEDGIVSRTAILGQIEQAQQAVARHLPDAIVTLGGDCLVSLVPFAYLADKYMDDLAVLWVDAHPDIMGPEQYNHAHAHVLASLMGHGDRQLGAAVSRPLQSNQILYVGVNNPSAWESSFIADNGMTVLSPEVLSADPEAVVRWLRASGKSRLAIHFDLDVLDPAIYDFLYFRDPDAPAGAFDGIPQGKMRIHEIVGILNAAAAEADVVGLTIAEYLPWSVMQVSRMLAQLPLLKVSEK